MPHPKQESQERKPTDAMAQLLAPVVALLIGPIREAIADELERLADATVKRELYSVQEMCIALGCSPPTLAAMVADGCPYHLCGTLKKFAPAEVLAWTRARAAAQAAEAERSAG